ncbi:efflux RND transporter periplasmic adaptor subunit [uncultured Desulfobacter sp.]|uniref:efflux RND transporter periplasmic adaptor subunit n=1 Tax=uncultured Desulfobacter sp. TaxID=240139 RepID=UPI002AA920FF|nr:efflux RND transporter periplasmic adaptor subunit [uncultured Desulfobacter sp.]
MKIIKSRGKKQAGLGRFCQSFFPTSFIIFSFIGICGAQQITISGFTEAVHDVVLGLPEAGRLAGIQVKEGDFVKKGQTLAFLDKRIEELEVKRRRTAANSRSELIFAQKKAKVLKTQYEAARDLSTQGNVISREEFEAKEIEYEQAVAEIQKIKTEKRLQKIELELAVAKLNQKILVTPFSGYVAEITKENGESIQAHENLVRVVNSLKGIFVGSAEAKIISSVKAGKEVTIKINGPTSEIVKNAKIIYVSPTIDTASSLTKIKAEFDNKDNQARLGAVAELIID